MTVPGIDISTDHVNPTPSELHLFGQCGDPFVTDAVNQQLVTFQADDRIEVIAGELRGLRGRLAGLGPHGTSTILSDSMIEPQDVRTSELRKKFYLGDRVHVKFGDHQNMEGFIINISDKSATLYCCPDGQRYSTRDVPGNEVSISPFRHFCLRFVPIQVHVDLAHIESYSAPPSWSDMTTW